MKIILVILAVYFFWVWRKRSNNEEFSFDPDNPAPQEVLSLDDGNQLKLLMPATITREWLNNVQHKYNSTEFDELDSLLLVYLSDIFEKAIEESNLQEDDIWQNMTRAQKTFSTFISFSGEVDNGGVFQFIFNLPTSIFAVVEMCEELGLPKLGNDYLNVLRELTGKEYEFLFIKQTFNNESLSWEKRWSAFSRGQKDLKSTLVIEDYFYDEEFKESLYKTVTDYVEKNMDHFAIIKE